MFSCIDQYVKEQLSKVINRSLCSLRMYEQLRNKISRVLLDLCRAVCADHSPRWVPAKEEVLSPIKGHHPHPRNSLLHQTTAQLGPRDLRRGIGRSQIIYGRLITISACVKPIHIFLMCNSPLHHVIWLLQLLYPHLLYSYVTQLVLSSSYG